MPPWWRDLDDRRKTAAAAGIAVFGLILYGSANVFVLREANGGNLALLEYWGIAHAVAIAAAGGWILWKLRRSL